MKTAGVREVRQNLSPLLDDVRKGREIVVTDRGRPIARLVPAEKSAGRPFPGRAAFRRAMPNLDPPLSSAIVDEREDRLA